MVVCVAGKVKQSVVFVDLCVRILPFEATDHELEYLCVYGS